MFHHHHHHDHACPVWVPSHGGQVPPNAIEGGRSGANHEVMFVARAYHSQGGMIPGKLVPSHRVCYVGCNHIEEGQHSYEVLVSCGRCHYYWQAASNGQVPPGAVECGQVHTTGEVMYVARGHPPPEPHGLHVGKLAPSHHCVYLPYSGTEHAVQHYEVLCKRPM